MTTTFLQLVEQLSPSDLVARIQQDAQSVGLNTDALPRLAQLLADHPTVGEKVKQLAAQADAASGGDEITGLQLFLSSVAADRASIELFSAAAMWAIILVAGRPSPPAPYARLDQLMARLPEDELPAVERAITDPLVRGLLNTPEGEDPLTAVEIAGILEGKRDAAAGRFRDFQNVEDLIADLHARAAGGKPE